MTLSPPLPRLARALALRVARPPPPPPPFARRAASSASSSAAPSSSSLPRPPPPPPPGGGGGGGGDNVTLAVYAAALAVGVAGLSYAAVPLYKVFCQATGYGGTTQKATEEKFKSMLPVPGARQVTVHFNADTSASMPWHFKPQQRSARVVPGETALAFYTAYNPSDKPVTGVSTYNISPMKAGVYFNKIQCFCFEEQRLRPHEEIDMPVFFYIDPLFLEDPAMDGVKSLTLSYTFFRTGEQEVMDVAHELAKRDDGKPADSASEKIRVWTAAVAKKTGVDAAGGGSVGSAGASAAGAGAAAQAPTPVSR